VTVRAPRRVDIATAVVDGHPLLPKQAIEPSKS
jgi:hypothetical protein